MAPTPKAFAAACALTVSLALMPVLATPVAGAEPTAAAAHHGREHRGPGGTGQAAQRLRRAPDDVQHPEQLDRPWRHRPRHPRRPRVQEQDADAAAFQEVAKDQLRQMQSVMPRYNFFPRRGLGTRGSAIQIAWNTKTVKQMETGYIMRPFLGWARPIPYVRLRDRETGRGYWVVAIHNAPGGQEHERDVSTAAEIKLIKELLASRAVRCSSSVMSTSVPSSARRSRPRPRWSR